MNKKTIITRKREGTHDEVGVFQPRAACAHLHTRKLSAVRPNLLRRHLCVRCARPHDVRSCTLPAQYGLQARPRRRQKHEFHHCRHLLANPLGHQLFPQPRLPAHAPARQQRTVQGGQLLRQITRPEEVRQE